MHLMPKAVNYKVGKENNIHSGTRIARIPISIPNRESKTNRQRSTVIVKWVIANHRKQRQNIGYRRKPWNTKTCKTKMEEEDINLGDESNA